MDAAGGVNFVIERDLSPSPEHDFISVGTALFLLDTNMASYILSGRSRAARRTMREIQTYAGVAISAVTEGENLFGLAIRADRWSSLG